MIKLKTNIENKLLDILKIIKDVENLEITGERIIHSLPVCNTKMQIGIGYPYNNKIVLFVENSQPICSLVFTLRRFSPDYVDCVFVVRDKESSKLVKHCKNLSWTGEEMYACGSLNLLKNSSVLEYIENNSQTYVDSFINVLYNSLNKYAKNANT